MSGNNKRSTDVCIIGAGVAGCAMAAYLADNGFKITVVERTLVDQDRIVGELMQPGGVQQLQKMGLEHLLEGFDAQPITGYALFLKDHHFSITYPGSETGRGLKNGKLLQTMRCYLIAHKNIELIEGNVTNLLEKNGKINGFSYTLRHSDEIQEIVAPLTIVCDGIFSGFRAQLSDSPKQISSYFLGMVLKDCELPFPGHGHVIAAEPSPVLCYPISSSEVRVLIDFPGSEAPRKTTELIDYLRNKVSPQMPKEIQPSFLAAIEEGKFKVMPNHLCPAKPKLISGAVLVGDSLNMRHPLTGGGMTVALSDVCHIGERLISIKDNFTETIIDEQVEAFYEKRHDINGAINILADALYGVMSNEDLKQACYSYLQKGGKCASVPLSLLSALNRDKDDLVKHFFAVALHGAKNVLLPSPTPSSIKRSYKMMKDAVHIVSPLILNENPGLLTKATFSVAEKVL